MDFYSITDTGKVRENNEDSFFNVSNEQFNIFIVCDGMGGHNAGEVASSIAVDEISKYIIDNFDSNNINQLIKESVNLAHEKIYSRSKVVKENEGMGTTLVICVVSEGKLYYANSGDSRIYIFRENYLHQISKDHSYVQDLVDIGALTKEQAQYHPSRNQITSCLGTEIPYKLHINSLELMENDLILLTTDGLTDLIEDNDIQEVLENNYNLRESCEILQYMANATGGRDNITITLARY